MMEPISSINLQQPLPPPVPQIGQPAAGGESFKDFLLDSIQRVNTVQSEADRAIESLFTGGDVSPAEVLTAVQKADLAFRMMMQARNKLVQVYQEIQNLQI